MGNSVKSRYLILLYWDDWDQIALDFANTQMRQLHTARKLHSPDCANNSVAVDAVVVGGME
jgi:hypothetical protein